MRGSASLLKAFPQLWAQEAGGAFGAMRMYPSQGGDGEGNSISLEYLYVLSYR